MTNPIKPEKPKSKARKCRGNMMWADDGNAFQCRACGHEVRRTRTNPMPDTDHFKKTTP